MSFALHEAERMAQRAARFAASIRHLGEERSTEELRERAERWLVEHPAATPSAREAVAKVIESLKAEEH